MDHHYLTKVKIWIFLHLTGSGPSDPAAPEPRWTAVLVCQNQAERRFRTFLLCHIQREAERIKCGVFSSNEKDVERIWADVRYRHLQASSSLFHRADKHPDTDSPQFIRRASSPNRGTLQVADETAARRRQRSREHRSWRPVQSRHGSKPSELLLPEQTDN